MRAVERSVRRILGVLAVGALWHCGSPSPAASADAGSTSTPSTDAAPAPGNDASVVDASTSGAHDASTAGHDGSSVSAIVDAAQPGDAAGVTCKRGIATNAAPSPGFVPTTSSPGVSWWYNWSNQGADAGGIPFVPMIWGSGALGSAIPAGSPFLLGFNEPNFKAQADLTSQEAAADWPTVQDKATRIGLVSPAVNFCGSAADPSQCTDPTVTDPYTYIKDFFADCLGCKVDYVAVHWYNCDLPSLKAYLEGNTDAGGTLQGFVQFGRPIWLTEFSCDTTHSVADQKAYMEAAVPYLENNPNVFRYSWFSAGGIPNAELMNSDGTLTDLGQTYAALPAACR